MIAAKGPAHTSKLMAALEDPASDLPQAARAILAVLVEELRSLDERVAVLDREIARHAKENAVARRLMTIPGIGAVTAAALTALGPAGRDVPARSWQHIPTKAPVKLGFPGALASSDRMLASNCSGSHRQSSPSNR